MGRQSKTRAFRTLAREVRELKREGQRVTLVHCTFDGAGTVDEGLFRSLRATSDVVVATIPNDDVLDERHHPEDERLALAASLDDIDLVGLVPWTTATRAIEELMPDVYGFPGSIAGRASELGPTPEELDALGSVGAELYTLSRRGDAVVEWRKRVEPGTRERSSFARALRERFSYEDVLDGLQAARGLKVAVVGETIIDEYAYCDAIGKSGKEPMLVTKFLSCESQAGGVLAIANHLADFCDHVEVVSALGTRSSREKFVRSSLRPEVKATFVDKPGTTIVKRRYIDAYTHAKMMGVYQLDDTPMPAAHEAKLLKALRPVLKRCDLVIVADYGHGLLTKRTVKLLAEKARFLAVNTQINAANSGFHTLSKYPRADFACLHEGELRLDARDLHGDLEEVARDAVARVDARALMVTLGRKGTWLQGADGNAFRCPALATTVVERIGAGDAVLALTSLAMAAGMAPELVSLVGNLAGAQAVAVMGNSASIRKTRLVESVRHLLEDRPPMHRSAE